MSPTAPPPADQSALWLRLLALDLDGTAALSFTHRLARDNGWTLAFARRVVLEYRRFVYLAATSGHPVTPSVAVDQAWHLHLVYTRSYWNELCGQVLGFALHHGPTQGGAAEGQKFADWYGRTLASYRLAFGTKPPPDIWPPAAVRFGEAPYYRRVNVRRHWLLPRPRLRWPQWPGLLRRRAWPGMLLVLAGCTARLPLNPFNWYGAEFLALFWTLCLTLLPAALWWRWQGRGPALPYDEPPLSTYELARLADRGQRVADSALAALVHEGRLALLPEQRVRANPDQPPTPPYEAAVWQLVRGLGAPTVADVRRVAQENSWPARLALDDSLVAKGLLLPAAERQRLDRRVLWTVLALGAFGLVKVIVGLTRDRPVGYLLFSLAALAGAYVLSTRLGAWTTGRGARLLADTKATVQQRRSTEAASGTLVALSVALFGLGELPGLGLQELFTALSPASSGGDSGGDGGSGCGGCGGCGS